MIKIKQYLNKTFSSNSYLLWKNGEKDCVLVDCGDTKQIIADIHNLELNLVSVFLSHSHFDHIYGLNELLSVFPLVKIFTTEFGHEALLSKKLNLSKYYQTSFELYDPSAIYVIETNCNSMPVWDLDMKIIHVPGHNPSCLAYCIDKYLFSGDAFIPGVKVATNLPNADKTLALVNYGKLKQLSTGYVVCPGHGTIEMGSKL